MAIHSITERRRQTAGIIFPPLKAIRLNCLDCSGYYPKQVRDCKIEWCTLWPYRMGKRPKQGKASGSPNAPQTNTKGETQ